MEDQIETRLAFLIWALSSSSHPVPESSSAALFITTFFQEWFFFRSGERGAPLFYTLELMLLSFPKASDPQAPTPFWQLSNPVLSSVLSPK